MNALKAVVIFLGILIVLGSIVVVVTIFNRLSAPDTVEEGAPAPASAAAEPFGVRDLDVPPGSRIVTAFFGDNRLFLQVRTPAGADRVLVVDPRTGATIGTLQVPTGGESN